ncbi:hypothetical protein QQ045_021502 [Rhodiola kirilowii]
MAEMNNSYTSWADPWDTKSDYPTEPNHNSGGGRAEKYKMKVGDGWRRPRRHLLPGSRRLRLGLPPTFIGSKTKLKKKGEVSCHDGMELLRCL